MDTNPSDNTTGRAVRLVLIALLIMFIGHELFGDHAVEVLLAVSVVAVVGYIVLRATTPECEDPLCPACQYSPTGKLRRKLGMVPPPAEVKPVGEMWRSERWIDEQMHRGMVSMHDWMHDRVNERMTERSERAGERAGELGEPRTERSGE